MRRKTLYLNDVPVGSASTWHDVAEILTKQLRRLVTIRDVQKNGSEGPDAFYVSLPSSQRASIILDGYPLICLMYDKASPSTLLCALCSDPRTHEMEDEMARQRDTERADGRGRESAGSLEPNPLWPNSVNVWVQGQIQLFDRLADVARRWLDRRREDLDAARQTIEQMGQSRETGELVQIQQEWVLGSVRRLRWTSVNWGKPL